MASARDITTFSEFTPEGLEWVDPDPGAGEIRIEEYDPAWPERYTVVAGRIRDALADRVLALEHVGSTSVPGLPAKPIVDIDLTVADNTDESAYVDDLVAVGMVLRVRERLWYGHRLLISPEPRAFVHVWSPGSPEAIRHRMLRDWLIENADDRERYVAAKRAAADAVRSAGGDMMQYNDIKEPVLREILERMFRARGLLD